MGRYTDELEQQPKDNRGWRERNTNKVFDSDTVFKQLKDAVDTSKEAQSMRLPTQLEPITKQEAEKFGYCGETMERMNQVRAQEREKFYRSRGLRPE